MAKPGLDALRIAAGGRRRCQKRVPVRKPAGPVELLTEQVLMVEVPPRLGVGSHRRSASSPISPALSRSPGPALIPSRGSLFGFRAGGLTVLTCASSVAPGCDFRTGCLTVLPVASTVIQLWG